jgi:hypothetical protein
LDEGVGIAADVEKTFAMLIAQSGRDVVAQPREELAQGSFRRT